MSEPVSQTASEPMIRALDDGDVTPVAELIAARQADPTTHVCYVGIQAEDIAEELTEAADWRARTLVAYAADGSVAGALLADIDEQMGRVWWMGPWTADPADAELAERLLDDAAWRWSELFHEQELGPDDRHAWMITLAEARGFHADTGSAVFTVELAAAPHGPDASSPARTMPLRASNRDVVAALHDELFGGTRTTGAKLVADEDTSIRVAYDQSSAVAGYIATQRHADGTGYIDYLGVAVAARRAGLGRTLITDAMGDMALRGVPSVHLTVRANLVGARALYRELGFTEERVIQPMRKGFTLD